MIDLLLNITFQSEDLSGRVKARKQAYVAQVSRLDQALIQSDELESDP